MINLSDETQPVATGNSELVVRLLAALYVKGMTKKDAILALAAIGAPVRLIADVTAATSNHVSVTLYQARKERRPREKSTSPKRHEPSMARTDAAASKPSA